MAKQRNVMVSEEHHRKLKGMAYHEDRFKSEIVHEALGAYFGEFRPIDTAPHDGRSILINFSYSDDLGIVDASPVFFATWNTEEEGWNCCGFDPKTNYYVAYKFSDAYLEKHNAGWLPIPGDNTI